MMEQYLALKAEAGDSLLFFRMGDFYEMFFQDAVAAAGALDIALTKRGQHMGEDIAMCGVPAHSHETYLARLISKGFRVAIAEQVEDPAEAKKRGSKSVVRRAVIRVVTPGTLTEENLLDARSANRLAAIGEAEGRMGLAWCDLSSGEFMTAPVDAALVGAELARLRPAELLLADGREAPAGHLVAVRPRADFDSTAGERKLCRRFDVGTLDGFGAFTRAELAAAGALMAFVEATQKDAAVRLRPPARHLPESAMLIDAATRASLELAETMAGSRKGSLLDCIDLTVTGAGARRLGADLAAPLTDPETIARRLDLVGWFVGAPTIRERVRAALKRIADIERALGRLSAGRGSPRDLGLLRDALSGALDLKRLLSESQLGVPAMLADCLDRIGPHGALVEGLAAALVPEPGFSVSDGGFIAEGFDPALDELRGLAQDGRRHIAALEARYRDATGIAALKIRHNNVLGYHVEVSARYADPLMAADSGFTHRQTLAGVVRFNSVDLADLAARIAEASTKALALETAHFAALRDTVLAEAEAAGETAAALARIDVAAALAELAARGGWVRPEVDASTAFDIRGGRHPVVEAALGTKREAFSDNLAEGRSTFMVEMVETAAILRQATARSLVILDEVGRGTSTYDGLAIAWAVVEAVHDSLASRCLFATHYHELTVLAERLSAVHLATVKVREWKGELVFLHEVIAGAADRSYGLAVARLAGLPELVTHRASEVLARLEQGKAKTGGIAAGLGDLPLFSAAAPAAPARDALRDALTVLRPDEMSPREALDALYDLKRLADGGGGAIS